ncbi:MAG: hypothetical protein JWM28_2884 [Chitinophagaceae bacterium]|nr:hypothetical protein [Chitinophagaceae bacterium]
MKENELSKLIVDVCFRIHKQYGPGLFEVCMKKYFVMNGLNKVYHLKGNMVFH